MGLFEEQFFASEAVEVQEMEHQLLQEAQEAVAMEVKVTQSHYLQMALQILVAVAVEVNDQGASDLQVVMMEVLMVATVF